MVFSKTSLNTLDILFLVNTIKDRIINSYLTKVYLTSLGLFFKLRKKDDIYFLLIDPEGWIFITNRKPEESLQNEFLKTLRMNLENRKILDIKAPYFDRYLRIDFEDSWQIHVEFMRGGNVILTQNGIIIDNLKRNYERFKPGIPYENKEINKLNLLEIDPKEAIELLKKSKGNLIASFWKLFSIPADISTEACLELNIDKDLLPIQIEEMKLIMLINKIKELIIAYLNSPNPNIILTNNNEYESFSNIDLKIFSNNKKIYFKELNEIIENYFFKFKEYELNKNIEEELKKKEEKKKRLIEELNVNIEKLYNENNKLKILIDKFKNNFTVLDNFLSKLNELVYKKEWDSIKEIINNEWNRELGEIYEINLKDKTLIIKFEDTLVPINIKENASYNLNVLYEKIKENNNKIKKIKEKISELMKIEEEVEPVRRIEFKEIKRKFWYENYLWFYTSNGLLAIAGRDSSQNETLIKKRTEKDDLIFHADIHGSPFLILKTKGKEVKDEDIAEAAQFVACYSSAWKAGLASVDVYWVLPEQVSKEAPSGMYLPKGSFMIYGKKNYIKNVPLELAIKIDELGNIVILPFKAIKEGKILKIIPGTDSKEKIINKIIKTIKELHKNINLKENEIKEFLIRNLPKGGFDLRIEVISKNK